MRIVIVKKEEGFEEYQECPHLEIKVFFTVAKIVN